MIIKKTVEERVVVTKENAKEILQYVHKDDWRYKFVKAMADGKDVEICTNNNIWKNETEDGYLFSAEESAYRIVEPDTRIDLSKKYSLIIGGRIFLKKHKIENISDLVNLVNEVGFSDYIMDYIWNGKRHPIEEEKGITKYTLLQSLNNFLIVFYLEKYKEKIYYVLKCRYSRNNVFLSQEEFDKTYKNYTGDLIEY